LHLVERQGNSRREGERREGGKKPRASRGDVLAGQIRKERTWYGTGKGRSKKGKGKKGKIAGGGACALQKGAPRPDVGAKERRKTDRDKGRGERGSSLMLLLVKSPSEGSSGRKKERGKESREGATLRGVIS